jgi:hypothetical protein
MNQLLARILRPSLAQEHRHRFAEINTSDCPSGCKVIGCETCDAPVQVFHSAVYGCPAGAR